ncbi:MAG: aminoacyl-tRNA hydrolase [Pseudomonadota bacterium]
MKLFVGLGNPGTKYARNRHNIGFMALDRIRERHNLSAWRKRFQGTTSDGEIDGQRVLLLKPETYMNESGRSVGAAARFLKIGLPDLIVFHDELDLQPGKLRIKSGGGNAGHNGLRSITSHLDNDYARVRIGIGHPGRKELVSGYVLHDFSRADGDWIDPLLDAIADAAGWLARGDSARFQTEIARHLGDDSPKPGKRAGDASKSPPTAQSRPPSGRQDPATRAGNRPPRPSQRDLARNAATSTPRQESGSQGSGRTALGDKLKQLLGRRTFNNKDRKGS